MYEMLFLPTVWIRQAAWLHFVHEIAAPKVLHKMAVGKFQGLPFLGIYG